MNRMNGNHPVDLDRLANEIEDASAEIHRTATPPPPSYSAEEEPRHQHSALQLIAHAATRLTWREAESMGTSIQSKFKEGVSLTAAIQSWAEDWEKFDR